MLGISSPPPPSLQGEPAHLSGQSPHLLLLDPQLAPPGGSKQVGGFFPAHQDPTRQDPEAILPTLTVSPDSDLSLDKLCPQGKPPLGDTPGT